MLVLNAFRKAGAIRATKVKQVIGQRNRMSIKLKAGCCGHYRLTVPTGHTPVALNHFPKILFRGLAPSADTNPCRHFLRVEPAVDLPKTV